VKIEGTREFAASRETVWDVLNDPARMAKIMPGVESFDVEDDRHWRANIAIPLGLGALRMHIDFEKTDERQPDYARLRAKGTGVGALLSMNTSFNLSEEGNGTHMRWQADVRVAGPVGSMGQRVLQPIVNQQVENVLTALDAQVTGSRDPEPASEAGSSGPDPELDDAGPPAEVTPEAEPSEAEGSSGAEEGLSPWDPETYSPKPEGPSRPSEDAPRSEGG
jgi:uncharacterized protein